MTHKKQIFGHKKIVLNLKCRFGSHKQRDNNLIQKTNYNYQIMVCRLRREKSLSQNPEKHKYLTARQRKIYLQRKVKSQEKNQVSVMLQKSRERSDSKGVNPALLCSWLDHFSFFYVYYLWTTSKLNEINFKSPPSFDILLFHRSSKMPLLILANDNLEGLSFKVKTSKKSS